MSRLRDDTQPARAFPGWDALFIAVCVAMGVLLGVGRALGEIREQGYLGLSFWLGIVALAKLEVTRFA